MVDSWLATWLLGWGICLAGAVLVWLLALARRDVSVVDVFWGLGFVALVWFDRLRGPEATTAHLLLAVLVTVWGVRLAAHIAWRSRGRGEDRRYRAMRDEHGPSFRWRSLVTVFALQGTLVALLSVVFLAPQSTPGLAIGPWIWVGVGLWAIGFAFEAVADFQLLRFQRRAGRQGRVLDSGLWRFSRHPNYFGEALLWWGYGAFAVAAGAPWALLACLAMTLLVVKVSGIPLLEAGIESRRPGYAEYARRTSAFVPWFPRRAVGGER